MITISKRFMYECELISKRVKNIFQLLQGKWVIGKMGVKRNSLLFIVCEGYFFIHFLLEARAETER